MTPRDFVYWLQGFFEITGKESITPEQVKMIKKHLDLVFEKSDITNPDKQVKDTIQEILDRANKKIPDPIGIWPRSPYTYPYIGDPIHEPLKVVC